MFGYTQVFDIWADPEFLNKVFDGKTAQAGMCSALYEKISTASLDRYFLEHAYRFEEDFASQFAFLDTLVEKSLQHCRFSEHLLKVWRNPEFAKSWLTPGTMRIGKISLWSRLKYGYFLKTPILRRWVIADLLQWTPDYMPSQYKRFLIPGEEPINDLQ